MFREKLDSFFETNQYCLQFLVFLMGWFPKYVRKPWCFLSEIFCINFRWLGNKTKNTFCKSISNDQNCRLRHGWENLTRWSGGRLLSVTIIMDTRTFWLCESTWIYMNLRALVKKFRKWSLMLEAGNNYKQIAQGILQHSIFHFFSYKKIYRRVEIYRRV